MKLAVTAMLLIGWTFAADSSALERRVASLKAEAIRAENAGKLSVAENKWLSAISASSALPPDKFRLKADLMAELANLYQRQNQESKVDAVYLDRLRFLEAQQKLREEPVLEIGIALFAIQSRYEARRNFRDGRDYMERAKAFYENCKETFPALRSVCDRRLADVEGLHGSALFLQKSFDEAIPFLQAVIARDDSSVRPEVLYAALMAYGQHSGGPKGDASGVAVGREGRPNQSSEPRSVSAVALKRRKKGLASIGSRSRTGARDARPGAVANSPHCGHSGRLT